MLTRGFNKIGIDSNTLGHRAQRTMSQLREVRMGPGRGTENVVAAIVVRADCDAKAECDST
jgi:hypothetical protein